MPLRRGDPNTREHRETRAVLSATSEVLTTTSPAWRAWQHCLGRWRPERFDTFDWKMVNYCLEQQLQALGQLGS